MLVDYLVLSRNWIDLCLASMIEKISREECSAKTLLLQCSKGTKQLQMLQKDSFSEEMNRHFLRYLRSMISDRLLNLPETLDLSKSNSQHDLQTAIKTKIAAQMISPSRVNQNQSTKLRFQMLISPVLKDKLMSIKNMFYRDLFIYLLVNSNWNTILQLLKAG